MNKNIMHIPNWINGCENKPEANSWLEKFNPHNGQLLCRLADSSEADTAAAIEAAEGAFLDWSELTPVKRGQILADIVSVMKTRAGGLADCIALETGKPPQDAKGEVGGAILQGEYFAGEGMRLYGRSLSSGMPGKYSHTVRQPRGVAGLIGGVVR